MKKDLVLMKKHNINGIRTSNISVKCTRITQDNKRIHHIIIIFQPYDRWGFSMMDMESDMRYLKYLTARLSAYRNVWWSLANEYDFLYEKTTEHWEVFGNYLLNNDPYNHLRSIHNCVNFYTT